MDDPDMGHWAYTYDARGNLYTQTDARNVTTVLEYDAVGRLDIKTYTIPAGSEVADTADVDYAYSSPTQVTMSDGSGNAVWNYDVTGNLLAETKTINGQTFTTGYGYDDYGRLQTMAYPDGETVTYSYNDMNQVNHVEGEDVYLNSAVYDTLGQPKTWNLGNGVEQTIGYDPNTFRPFTVEAYNLGLEQVQDLTLDFDIMGRLDLWADNSQGAAQWMDQVYDSFSRLDIINSNVTLFEQDYDYDLLGNLIDRDGLVFTYDPGDRPHLPAEDSAGTNYTYDANGNMASRLLNSGAVISYTYDAENRLTSVISNTISGTVITAFIYDGNGQRVRQIAGNGPTKVYLGDHIEGLARVGPVVSGSEANITNSSVDSTHPCVAVNENYVPYFVWSEDDHIWFNRFDNPGFLEPTNVSNETADGINGQPSINVDANGVIHAAWIRYSEPPEGGTKEIYYGMCQ
jgi:YD repeat-containing protein